MKYFVITVGQDGFLPETSSFTEGVNDALETWIEEVEYTLEQGNYDPRHAISLRETAGSRGAQASELRIGDEMTFEVAGLFHTITRIEGEVTEECR